MTSKKEANSSSYEVIIRQLKARKLFTPIVLDVWHHRPRNDNPQEEIFWFTNELVESGCVDESTMFAITENINLQKISQQQADQTRRISKDFGNYLVMESLGEGEAGKVYKAKDKELGRDVALKILLQETPKSKERFLREAKTMAQIKHSGIATVYEMGKEKGLYFIAMEYIPGETLEKKIKRQSISTAQALEIFYQICLAMESAHSAGVIHRDLKPSNVVFNSNNEPVIVDFGLAKNRQNQAITGASILGTPHYMSPEQCQEKEVDHRSDIFSLGTILYEMLTGYPPFDGKHPLQVIQNILEQEPTGPKVIKPSLDADIETICLKCLEKDVQLRYQKARDVAKDVQRFNSKRVIKARPVSAWRKLAKWYHRNQVVINTTVIALGLLFLLTAVYLRSLYYFDQRYEEEAKKSRIRLAKIAVARADQAYKDEKYGKSSALSSIALKFLQSLSFDEANNLKKNARNLIRLSIKQYGLINRKQIFYPIIPSPDLTKTLHFKRHIDVYKQISNTLQISLKNPFLDFPKPSSIIFSPDSRFLAIRSNRNLSIWDTEQSKLAWKKKIRLPLGSIRFSPNNLMIAYEGANNTVHVWNFRKDKLVGIYTAKTEIASPHRALAFSPDSQLLAHSFGNIIVVRSVGTKEQIAKLKKHSSYVLDLAFSSDGKKLVSSSFDKTIKVWDIANQEQLFSFSQESDNYCYLLARSHQHSLIASAHNDGTIKVMDLNLGKIIHSFVGEARCHSLLFTTNDKTLISCHQNEIKHWKIFNGHHIGKINVKHQAVQNLDISFDDSVIATNFFQQSKISLWHQKTQRKIQDLFHPDIVHGLSFSPKDFTLATSCADGKIRLWDVKHPMIIEEHDAAKPVYDVVFHPQRAELLAAILGTEVLIWNRDKKQVYKLVHNEVIYRAVFSRRGQLLCLGNKLTVWNLHQRKIVKTYPLELSSKISLRSIAVDHQGEYCLCSDYVKVYRVHLKTDYVQKIQKKQSYCAFIPNLDGFLVGGNPSILFDRQTFHPRQSFHDNSNLVYDTVLTKDNKLIFGNSQNQIRFLQLPTDHIDLHNQVPQWIELFPKTNKIKQQKSPYDFRQDLPGWFIEKALNENPEKLIQILFQIDVHDDLLLENW